MAQTLTWQGAYVVAEVGIAAPHAKSDEQGRFTDVPTLTSISRLTDALLGAPTKPAADLGELAVRLLEALGIDTSHVPPAAPPSGR